MQIKTFQIVMVLGAAIAFALAIMAAGALLLSVLFALIGAVLIGWLAYGVARTMLERRLRRVSHDDTPAVPKPTH